MVGNNLLSPISLHLEDAGRGLGQVAADPVDRGSDDAVFPEAARNALVIDLRPWQEAIEEGLTPAKPPCPADRQSGFLGQPEAERRCQHATEFLEKAQISILTDQLSGKYVSPPGRFTT